MKKLLFIFLLVLTGKALSAQVLNQDVDQKKNVANNIKVDSSDLYGLVPERPIKVGGAFESGPSKQIEYLKSLRDPQNKRVKFERKGSCCGYESKNALFGSALLDMYEITYLDNSNKKQKAILYLTFYDYEKPKAIKDFTLKD